MVKLKTHYFAKCTKISIYTLSIVCRGMNGQSDDVIAKDLTCVWI